MTATALHLFPDVSCVTMLSYAAMPLGLCRLSVHDAAHVLHQRAAACGKSVDTLFSTSMVSPVQMAVWLLAKVHVIHLAMFFCVRAPQM